MSNNIWTVYSSPSAAFDQSPGHVGRLTIPSKDEMPFAHMAATMTAHSARTLANVVKYLDKLSSERKMSNKCVPLFFPASDFHTGREMFKSVQIRAEDIQGAFSAEEAELFFDQVCNMFNVVDETDFPPTPNTLKYAMTLQKWNVTRTAEEVGISEAELMQILEGKRPTYPVIVRLRKVCRKITPSVKGFNDCVTWEHAH